MSRPGRRSLTRAANLTQRRKLRAVGCGLVAALCLLLLGGVTVAAATPAGPAAAPDRPPILMVGGGLGDSQRFVTHWLGDAAVEVASKGSLVVLTSKAPQWWSGDAPDTYVLATSTTVGGQPFETYTVADLAWALDRLAERHPGGKTVLVCQGASGLMARAYLEDLGDPLQSARADIIGLVTLGTPHQGVSLQTDFPDLDLWAPYAAGGGLTAADLATGSAFLTGLNAKVLPPVVKTLFVRGASASLSGRNCDGVAALEEQVPPASVVAGALETSVDVRARASDVWSLADSWLAKTKKGGALLDEVDGSEVDALGLVRSYSTMTEVKEAVKTFYTTWFSGAIPTTHISSRLVVDVSGSMGDSLGGVTKLAAARQACATFADSMAARALMAQVVPEDIALVTFTTRAEVTVRPTDNPALLQSALASLRAGGNTNIGRALEVAVGSFASTPGGARKVVVLLSDGDVTSGLNNAAVLAGPVAAAAGQGIMIDTIGLGRLKREDKAFLQQIATNTGGSFTEALDAFELSRDFLRTRYESLGSLLVDSEVKLVGSTPINVDLAAVGDDGLLLEMGLVPNGQVQWRLLRDGAPVPAADVKVDTSLAGAVTLAVEDPVAGSYVLELQSPSGTGELRAQVFVVLQRDVFREQGMAVPPSSGMLWLIILGAAAAVAVILVVVLSLRHRTVAEEDKGGGGTTPPSGDPPFEGVGGG